MVDIKIGTRAKVKIEAKTDPKSRLRKPELVKLSAMEILLLCVIILLEAKSSSGLLEIVKLYRGFFQQVVIFLRVK